MPASDLVLNVRQLAGYPGAGAPWTNDAILIQRGLGGPYLTISPAALVGTALAQGGDMAINGQLSLANLLATSGTVVTFAAQSAQIGTLGVDVAATIGGLPVTTQAYVDSQIANLTNSTVWSFNGRLGCVDLTWDDVRRVGGAPIFSPFFLGQPAGSTPADPTTCSSQLSTTAFVQNAISSRVSDLLANHPFVFSFNGRTGAVTVQASDIESAVSDVMGDYAPLDSPAFSGMPTAPTPLSGSSSGQIATTAFVVNALAGAVGDAVAGVSSFNGSTGAITFGATQISALGFITQTQLTAATAGFVTSAALAAYVPLAGGTMTGVLNLAGNSTAITQAAGTSNTTIATTAFVIGAVAAATAGVSSFMGRTGAVTLTSNDISAASGLINPSAALSGVPTAPTASSGTSTTQIASTAFVSAAMAALTISSIPGITNGSTAAVGMVGQVLSAYSGSTTIASQVEGVYVVVGTLNLTAGDWDVFANVDLFGDPTASGYMLFLGNNSIPIGQTGSTQLSQTAFFSGMMGWGAPSEAIFTIGPVRLNLTAAGAAQLRANIVGTGTSSCQWFIWARRAR